MQVIPWSIMAVTALLAVPEVRAANVLTGANTHHFGILCRIYKVATTARLALYDLKQIESIRDKIDTINASLGSSKWFGEVSKAEDQDKLSNEFKAHNGEVPVELWKRWKSSIERVSKTENFPHLGSNLVALDLARRKVRQIQAEVDRVILSIQKMTANKDREEAQAAFLAAVEGEPGANKVEKGGYPKSGTREALCGGGSGLTQTGSAAGHSLVADLLCLCAKGPSTAVTKVCGETVADGTEWQSGSTGGDKAPNAVTNWQNIKTGCDLMSSPNNATITGAFQAVAEFETEVSKGGISGAARPETGLFGTCETALYCGAAVYRPNTRVYVVFYSTATTDGWQSKVPWLKKIKEGLDKWQKIEETNTTIQQDIMYLKILEARAVEVYGEARAALELGAVSSGAPTQEQSQKQNPTAATDKPPTQEPGAVSTATIPRFIPPWTLLI
uniref:Variable surface glycoprotein n=1 Tax=Trypanosoma congolense TaxID=5692 RepID=Q26861_TRYCO|nr:variable surface glycoprotein [Trypanosoma congolense]